MLRMKWFSIECLKQKDYVVYCYDQSAMNLSQNNLYNFLTKHINVSYYWIREIIGKGNHTIEKKFTLTKICLI